MFTHSTREKHGIRKWWHFGEDRKCIGVELYWWSPRFGVSFGPDEEGWNFSLKIPPFALYLNLEGFPLWRPTRTCVATWDNNRVFTLVDRREFDFYISEWTVRWTLWGRWGEWRSKDPWWIRGHSVDLKQLVLGKPVYARRVLQTNLNIQIPLPEGTYTAIAEVVECTWKRPRWLTDRRVYTDVQIPKGIPFAGKGESSYDCDDDGLFGYSADGVSLDHAIAVGVESVLNSRRRYGNPSEASIQQALSPL